MNKKQEKKLVIVGNGFDRFHGIPSCYSDFKTYLDKNPDTFGVVEEMEKYINPDELWSDFEQSLGMLDSDALKDDCSWALKSYGDEDWSDSYHHDYQYELNKSLEFAPQIPEYLKQWIETLDTNVEKVLTDDLISKEAIYITFNYTDTLERAYKIPEKQIIHIHGKVGQSSEHYIVGHGDGLAVSEEVYQDGDKDVRIIEGEEIINGYYKATYKDVEQIISENSFLWNCLSDIDEVWILGHSLSEVDIPYFQKIKEEIKNQNCIWHVSYYEIDKRAEFEHVLQKCIGVESQFIKSIRLDDYRRIRI